MLHKSSSYATLADCQPSMIYQMTLTDLPWSWHGKDSAHSATSKRKTGNWTHFQVIFRMRMSIYFGGSNLHFYNLVLRQSGSVICKFYITYGTRVVYAITCDIWHVRLFTIWYNLGLCVKISEHLCFSWDLCCAAELAIESEMAVGPIDDACSTLLHILQPLEI